MAARQFLPSEDFPAKAVRVNPQAGIEHGFRFQPCIGRNALRQLLPRFRVEAPAQEQRRDIFSADKAAHLA